MFRPGKLLPWLRTREVKHAANPMLVRHVEADHVKLTLMAVPYARTD
jgi:hypothetical protein